MPGWVLYGVLYLLFAGVVLWLATEALFQHGAPVLFRLLALAGFSGLWAGIVLKTNALIFGGLAVFVVAQAVVSMYVRRGEHRAWALGGGRGRRGRRAAGARQEPPARSDGVFGDEAGQEAGVAFAGPDEFGEYREHNEFDGDPGDAVGAGRAFGVEEQTARPAAAPPMANVDFDTQVGIGFGPGFAPPGVGFPAAPTPPGAQPADHLGDPAEMPVISPFVDDLYAQEIAEEYASGEARDLSSATESTAQFPRPFTDVPSASYPDTYQQAGQVYGGPQPPMPQSMPPAGSGFGQPAGEPSFGPAGHDGTWLDSYVSPREAGVRREAGPVEPTPMAGRGPSPWDTYERRVRLPESAPPAPGPQAEHGGPWHAAPPSADQQWATDQLGHAQQEPGPGQGGPAGDAPAGGNPAPWARLPEQPQPGHAAPRQPSGPGGGPVSWRDRDARAAETLIGQIVSDEDLSFGDQWADEPAPSFGDRPHPRPPEAGRASSPAEPVADPGAGWSEQAGPDGGFADQEASEAARHGTGRHGRGKRRGRR